MIKKIILVILVVIVLVGGGFVYMDRKMAAEIAALPAPAESVNKATNLYTFSEIAMHNTRADCWMSIGDKVYNVTSFIDLHAGGEVILSGCGTDATAMFASVREHAKASVDALKSKFEIGSLQK